MFLAGIILLFLGLFVGYFAASIMLKKHINGALRIDKSDPDEAPYIFLELKENPQILERSKYVTLEVIAKNYISQD